MIVDGPTDASGQDLWVLDRRSTAQAKLPRVVRYTIDGRHRSKSFRIRIEADRYRGLLLQALQTGGRFDETTGEP